MPATDLATLLLIAPWIFLGDAPDTYWPALALFTLWGLRSPQPDVPWLPSRICLMSSLATDSQRTQYEFTCSYSKNYLNNRATKYLLHNCLTWKARSFKERAFQCIPCWVVYVFLGLNLRPVHGLLSCWELSFWTAIIQAHQQLLTVCSLSNQSVFGPFCWVYFLKVVGPSEATVAREEWACLSIVNPHI